MTFEDALQVLSRDERFKAAIYAMNTLLIQKGVYSTEEFERLFCEHALNATRRAAEAESVLDRVTVSAIREVAS